MGPPERKVRDPFGSHARGKATRRSDVDVAVYFADAHDLTSVNGIAAELEALLRKDVDLIVLNEANASVAWAALRGIPLVVRDRAFYLQYMLMSRARRKTSASCSMTRGDSGGHTVGLPSTNTWAPRRGPDFQGQHNQEA